MCVKPLISAPPKFNSITKIVFMLSLELFDWLRNGQFRQEDVELSRLHLLKWRREREYAKVMIGISLFVVHLNA